MCNLETEWDLGLPLLIKKQIIRRLQEMVSDQLIEVTDTQVIVKEEGRMYVRNICMAFDLKLIENKPNTRLFSMTI
jgi:oxygen-independent coproporphyrinogen-3 oxidase